VGNNATAILKGFFASREDIILAFLFGSVASGKTRDDSDVDIAVYFAEGYTKKAVNLLWSELEKLLESQVDLVLLNKDNPTLAWSALRGIPLLIRDRSFYLEYMLRVSREAEDLQDFIIDLYRRRKALRREVH
jgi:predicted nucleotidyltransferase